MASTQDVFTLEDMLKRDSNLIHMVAHKYKIEGYSHEDLYQEGAIEYMNVVKRNQHNPSKACFTTYIVACIENCYKDLFNKQRTLRSISHVTNVALLTDSGAVTHKKNKKSISTSVEYDYDEKIYYDEIFDLIEKGFGKLAAMAFVDKIKGYKISETAIRYKHETGESVSVQYISVTIKRNCKNIFKMLRNKNVI